MPGPLLQLGNAIIVQLLVSVHEGHECTRIQQEFIFHGATAGSSNRDDAGLGRDDHWQCCQEDRAPAQSDEYPAGYPDIAPALREPLQIACVLAVSPSVLVWQQDPPIIAWSIDAPYRIFQSHCIVRQ